jgi:hypothetical protein
MGQLVANVVMAAGGTDAGAITAALDDPRDPNGSRLPSWRSHLPGLPHPRRTLGIRFPNSPRRKPTAQAGRILFPNFQCPKQLGVASTSSPRERRRGGCPRGTETIFPKSKPHKKLRRHIRFSAVFGVTAWGRPVSRLPRVPPARGIPGTTWVVPALEPGLLLGLVPSGCFAVRRNVVQSVSATQSIRWSKAPLLTRGALSRCPHFFQKNIDAPTPLLPVIE